MKSIRRSRSNVCQLQACEIVREECQFRINFTDLHQFEKRQNKLENKNCPVKEKTNHGRNSETAHSVLYFKMKRNIQNYFLCFNVSQSVKHRVAGMMFSTLMIVSILAPQNRLLIVITFDDETKRSEF